MGFMDSMMEDMVKGLPVEEREALLLKMMPEMMKQADMTRLMPNMLKEMAGLSDMTRVKILYLCNPEGGYEILKSDDFKAMSVMMPMPVSVY